MLLAVETVGRSATACAVAADGTELAFADLAGAPAEAGLMPMLTGLLAAHGPPSRLAIAVGPGSFTGLRTGISTLRTLAWLDRLLAHPVDSLAACAAAAGPGRWWVALPLKKDTTFHGLFAVAADGGVRVERAIAAIADAGPLPWDPGDAVAIGPALAGKPDLIPRLRPGTVLGSPAPPTARGVARLADQVAPVGWDRLLPQYGIAPAPVLQRGG